MELNKYKWHKAIQIEHIADYKIQVMFEDGTTGIVDMTEFCFSGVFEPIKDINVFRQAYIDERGAICWLEDLDMASDRIYYDIKTKNGVSKLYGCRAEEAS